MSKILFSNFFEHKKTAKSVLEVIIRLYLYRNVISEKAFPILQCLKKVELSRIQTLLFSASCFNHYAIWPLEASKYKTQKHTMFYQTVSHNHFANYLFENLSVIVIPHLSSWKSLKTLKPTRNFEFTKALKD